MHPYHNLWNPSMISNILAAASVGDECRCKGQCGLVSSASRRKLISLIRISSLSAHTCHHLIKYNQRNLLHTAETSHRRTPQHTCTAAACSPSLHSDATSESFKGAIKAERLALIKFTTLKQLRLQQQKKPWVQTTTDENARAEVQSSTGKTVHPLLPVSTPGGKVVCLWGLLLDSWEACFLTLTLSSHGLRELKSCIYYFNKGVTVFCITLHWEVQYMTISSPLWCMVIIATVVHNLLLYQIIYVHKTTTCIRGCYF